MTTEDLMRFCAINEGPALHLCEPFVLDGYKVGTDGRVLVRMLCNEPNTVRSNLPKAFPAMPVFDETKSLPWPDVDLSLRAIEHCRSCKDGRWYFDNYNPDSNFSSTDMGDGSMECEDCGGTAQYIHWKQMKLSGCLYNSGYIWLVGQLPNVRYVPAASDCSPMRFTFDGGDGLLMPMAAECDECNCTAKGCQP